MTGWVSLLRLFFFPGLPFITLLPILIIWKITTAIKKERIFSDILKIRSGIPSAIRYIK